MSGAEMRSRQESTDSLDSSSSTTTEESSDEEKDRFGVDDFHIIKTVGESYIHFFFVVFE